MNNTNDAVTSIYGTEAHLKHTEIDVSNIGGEIVQMGGSKKKTTCPAIMPERLEGAERLLYNYFRYNVTRPPIVLFPPIDHNIYDVLHNLLNSEPDKYYVTLNEFIFDNKFILSFAGQQSHFSSLHMDVLMFMLGEQHESTLATKRSRFLYPELINLIMAKQRSFKAAKDKSKIRWPHKLKYIVNYHNAIWLKDIDTIYAPMLCNSHWVGLVIKLQERSIEVLNPGSCLLSLSDGEKDLKQIASAMPYVLNQCAGCGKKRDQLLTPFKLFGSPSSPQSTKFGNCAPITVKLMEMHLHGYKQPIMSHNTIMSVRKQYLLDVYEKYVVFPWFCRYGD